MAEHDQETTVYYKAIADFSSLAKGVDQAKAKIAELRAAEAKANAQSLTEQEFLAAARGGQGKDLDGVSKKLQNYKKLLAEVSSVEKTLGGQKSALSSLSADLDKLNAKLTQTKKLLDQAHAPAPPAVGSSSSGGDDAAKIKKTAEATTAAAVANVAYTQSSKGAHAARAQESRDLDKLTASLIAYASARGLANAADKQATGFKVPSGVAEANVAYTNLNSVLKETDNLLGKVSRKKNFDTAFGQANATTRRTSTPTNNMAVALRNAPGEMVNTGQQASAAAAAAEAAAVDAAARAWTRYAAARATASAGSFVASMAGEIAQLGRLPGLYAQAASAAEKYNRTGRGRIGASVSGSLIGNNELTATAARGAVALISAPTSAGTVVALGAAFRKLTDEQKKAGDEAKKNQGIFAALRNLFSSFTGIFSHMFSGPAAEGAKLRDTFTHLGTSFRGVTNSAKDLAGSFTRIFSEGQKVRDIGAAIKGAFSGMGGGFNAAKSSVGDFFSEVAKGSLKSMEFLNFGWRAPILLIVPLIGSLLAAVNPLVAILGAGAGSVIGFGSALSNLGAIAVALPGIFSAVGAAIGGMMLTFGGITKLFSAYQTAKASGTTQAQGASNQAQTVADDKEALGKAKLDLGRAYVDSQRAITDAENNLSQAQQNATKAQKALNDARKQARKDLRDLELEVERSKNTELGAQAAVDHAKEALNNTLADPNSTKGDKEAAKYDLQQAKYNQQDTKQQDKDNAALLKYYKSHGGIEAMPGVQSAEQQVVAASQAVRDAAQALTRAKQDQPYTIYNAQKTVRDAQDKLAKDQTLAGSTGSNPWAAYQLAFDKLSPSAQKVVTALLGMSKAWSDMRKAVQENFFTHIVDDMGKLKDLIPGIQDLFGTASGKIGDFVHKALAGLDSNEGKKALGAIAGYSGEILTSIGNGILSLADALTKITVAAGPFTTWLVQGLANAAKSFDDLVGRATKGGSSSTLATYLEKAKQPLSDLWTIIKNISGTIWNYLQAASGASRDVLTALKSITGGWLQSSKDARKDGSPFKKWLDDIVPLEKAIGRVFGAFGDWFVKWASNKDNIGKAAKILNDLVDKVGKPLGKLLDTLGKSDLFDGLETALGAVTNLINDLLKAGGITLLKALYDFFTSVANVLDGLTNFGNGVAPGFGALITLLAALAGFMVFKTVMPLFFKSLFGYLKDIAGLNFNSLLRVLDKMLGIVGKKLPGFGEKGGPNTFTGKGPNFPKSPGPGAPETATETAAKQAADSAPRGYTFTGFGEDGLPQYVKTAAGKKAKVATDPSLRRPTSGTPGDFADAINAAKRAAPRGYTFHSFGPDGMPIYLPKDKIGDVRVTTGVGGKFPTGPTDGSEGTLTQRLKARAAAPRGTKFTGWDTEGNPLYSDASRAQTLAAVKSRPLGTQFKGFDKDGKPIYARTESAIKDLGDLKTTPMAGPEEDAPFDPERPFNIGPDEEGPLASGVDFSGTRSAKYAIYSGADRKLATEMKGPARKAAKAMLDANKAARRLNEERLRGYSSGVTVPADDQEIFARAYRAAVEADPRLAKIDIGYDPSYAGGGYAMPAVSPDPVKVRLGSPGPGGTIEESVRKFSDPKNPNAQIIAEKLGVKVEDLTPEIVKSFILTHELGHASDFLDMHEAGGTWADHNRLRTIEMKSLPHSHLAGHQMAPWQFEEASAAYRRVPSEASGDDFAARVLRSMSDTLNLPGAGPTAAGSEFGDAPRSLADYLHGPKPTGVPNPKGGRLRFFLDAEKSQQEDSRLAAESEARITAAREERLAARRASSPKELTPDEYDAKRQAEVDARNAERRAAFKEQRPVDFGKIDFENLPVAAPRPAPGPELGNPNAGRLRFFVDAEASQREDARLHAESEARITAAREERLAARRASAPKELTPDEYDAQRQAIVDARNAERRAAFKERRPVDFSKIVSDDSGFVDFSKLAAPAKAAPGVLDGLGLGGVGMALSKLSKPLDAVTGALAKTPLGKAIGAIAKSPVGRFLGKAIPLAGGFLGGMDLLDQWGGSLKNDKGETALGKSLQGDKLNWGSLGKLGSSMGLSAFNDAMDGAAIGENFGGPWGALAGGVIGGVGGLVRGAGNAVGWDAVLNNGKKGKQSQGVFNGNSWTHGAQQIGDAVGSVFNGKSWAQGGKQLGAALGHGGQQIGDFAKGTAGFLKDAAHSWKTGVSSIGKSFGSSAKHGWDQITGFFKKVTSSIGTIFKNVGTWWDKNVSKPVAKGFKDIHDWWQTHVNEPIAKNFKGIHDWWQKNINEPVGKMFTDLGANWKKYVQDPISTVMGHIGDFFSNLAKTDIIGAIVNFFTGGKHKSTGGIIQGYATGGRVGPFQPQGTDTIPAMLTPGEFVIRKAVVDSLGVNTLNRLNAGHFSSGGAVNPAEMFFATGGLVGIDSHKLSGINVPAAALNSRAHSSTVNDNGITIHELVVNNPVPERGSVSVARKLRSMAYFGSPNGA